LAATANAGVSSDHILPDDDLEALIAYLKQSRASQVDENSSWRNPQRNRESAQAHDQCVITAFPKCPRLSKWGYASFASANGSFGTIAMSLKALAALDRPAATRLRSSPDSLVEGTGSG